MKKTFYSTPNHPYEKRYGYYRAVRKGPFIAVAGTTPYDPETQKLLHPGDAGKQAAAIFTEIIKAIKAVGSKGAEDVIRVRVFLAVRSSRTLPSLLADHHRLEHGRHRGRRKCFLGCVRQGRRRDGRCHDRGHYWLRRFRHAC